VASRADAFAFVDYPPQSFADKVALLRLAGRGEGPAGVHQGRFSTCPTRCGLRAAEHRRRRAAATRRWSPGAGAAVIHHPADSTTASTVTGSSLPPGCSGPPTATAGGAQPPSPRCPAPSARQRQPRHAVVLDRWVTAVRPPMIAVTISPSVVPAVRDAVGQHRVGVGIGLGRREPAARRAQVG